MNKNFASLETDPVAHLQPVFQQAVGDIYIAYSGGLDSSVLLHAAVQCAEQLDIKHSRLRAVHVNHNLHPQSRPWARHCNKQCERVGVALHSLSVRLPKGKHSEDAARTARYNAFVELLSRDDVLLLAHHADDQAETLLLRLVRGSGADGLTGMAQQRSLGAGTLLRPFLQLERQHLLDWAESQGLCWLDDPSNKDTRYARNYLRNTVLPLLNKRWPSWVQRASHTASHLRSRSQALDYFLQQQYEALSAQTGALPLDALRNLAPGQCAELVRYACRKQVLPTPDTRQMQQLQKQLHSTESGHSTGQVRWGGGVQACQWRDNLWIFSTPAELPAETHWNPTTQGELCVGNMRLSAHRGRGQLRLPEQATLALRFRKGGERILLAHRGGHHQVKKLMQEAEIPPWLRHLQPLLYLEDELVAVGLNHNWHISSDYWCEQGGWEISSGSTVQ